MAQKRDKINQARVPSVLFLSVTEKNLKGAIERGQLRGSKTEPLQLHSKQQPAKRRNGRSLTLRIAAHAACQSGVVFYRGQKGVYETSKIPLQFAGCPRLPKAIKGVERVDAAGGVVITGSDRPRVLLLLKGTEKSGRWVLPKGKRRPSEARRRAARREVLEESGLEKVTVKRFLIRESYFDRERGRVIFKEVSYYLMRCPKDKTKLKPNRSEGFQNGRWMSFEAALHVTSPVRAHRPLRKARLGLKGA